MAVARGTKSTPPPTPEMGAITPITRVNTNRIAAHFHTRRTTSASSVVGRTSPLAAHDVKSHSALAATNTNKTKILDFCIVLSVV
jgi:hypothetical protein